MTSPSRHAAHLADRAATIRAARADRNARSATIRAAAQAQLEAFAAHTLKMRIAKGWSNEDAAPERFRSAYLNHPDGMTVEVRIRRAATSGYSYRTSDPVPTRVSVSTEAVGGRYGSVTKTRTFKLAADGSIPPRALAAISEGFETNRALEEQRQAKRDRRDRNAHDAQARNAATQANADAIEAIALNTDCRDFGGCHASIDADHDGATLTIKGSPDEILALLERLG